MFLPSNKVIVNKNVFFSYEKCMAAFKKLLHCEISNPPSQMLVCVCVCLGVNLVHDFHSVLLRQELVKHTSDAAEKSNLKIALDAMKVSAALLGKIVCNHGDFSLLPIVDGFSG